MLIFVIFGTRGVTSTADRGWFHCPQCGGRQAFARKKVRRFFTLFFVPLIPLDRVGGYVECAMCSGTFDPTVLDHDPDATAREFEALYKMCVRELMVRMLLADGRVEESELEVIARAYPKLTGETIERERIEKEVERLSGDGGDPLGAVRASAPFLNDMGKEAMIRAAMLVAGADGELDDAEMSFLDELAEGLEISPAHLRGILAEEGGRR